MRKKIVAGNWKMNLEFQEAAELLEKLGDQKNDFGDVEVVVFPSTLYLSNFAFVLDERFKLGAQNVHSSNSGAFTGEISATQLHSIGVEAALIGHSERRLHFEESHEFLKQKVDNTLEAGLTVFFCCGEPLEVRESGQEKTFVKKQLEDSLFHLADERIEKVVIAYEPVWAIGTGRTATIDQAEEMHAAIRSWLSERYSENLAEKISIIYGGSCNQNNAKELFACPNVDGGLIGGASLIAESFIEIIKAS